MTASPPKVNGHARPPAPPVLGDWQPIEATPTQADTPTPAEPAPAEAPESDLVAQAKAEAIRAQAWADAEAKRIAAEAEAEGVRIKADGEAKAAEILAVEQAEALRLENEKQTLTLQRNQLRFRREEVEQLAKIEKAEKDREDIERARETDRRQAAEQQQAEVEEQEKKQKSEKSWRRAAKSFYGMCQLVALPVQTHAFWLPSAPWLLVAPVMLESGALVVQRGARAAVDDHRPHWHYRLISWCLAAIAASVNLAHGLTAFDPATAISTAFASLAGPGVYDLYEHGRIRKRDGALTRRERKAQEKAIKAEAAAKAEADLREAERQAYREKAARQAAATLDEARRTEFPDVHRHALKLAADLGETVITEAIWKRAKLDVDGALPGESADIFRMRNAAEMRVEAARQKKPVATLSKTTNAQRGIQTPRSSYKPVPPVRKPGDTPRYNRAAGRAHGELLRRSKAAQNTSPNDN
ncbi:hypothetical protein ABT186_01910 [Streptomyces sp. NPDC001634]|uniref:hypothetical protein n=1 Tax=Streptomyces sp. NPDC001634 TaxID=3154390 RepID=UPI00331A9E33